MSTHELPTSALRRRHDPASLGFATTNDITDGHHLVGQERALRAIDFGLKIKADGYNIYIAGEPGAGRRSVAMDNIKRMAENEPVPDDICYVHNFAGPDAPKAIKLPAGTGCRFRDDMKELTDDLEGELRKAFLAEDYEVRKREIMEKIESERDSFSSELHKKADEKGFSVQQSPMGVFIVPLRDGNPLNEKEFDQLPEDQKSQIKETQDEVQHMISEESRRLETIRRDTKEKLRELDWNFALGAVGHIIEGLRAKYKDFDAIVEHLDQVRKDILENTDALKKENEQSPVPFQQKAPSKDSILKRYQVNILVDNCNTKGAPVVVEHSPTYYNLVGQVEYTVQFGVMSTDFTMIKPGAALRANGGYLVIHANEILRDYYAWDALKKIAHYRQIKIENIAQRYGFAPTMGLKPQPVEVNLKVVLIGNPLFYYLLYSYDEEFSRLFKVKADFDTVLPYTQEHIHQYIAFFAEQCRTEKHLPFDNTSIARLLDYSNRLSEHKQKLSARLLDMADLMRQADYWARTEEADVVTHAHIDRAWNEKIYRSQLVEEKLDEMIEEGTIRITTTGEAVGQINGISIIDAGDYVFGKPSRITARTFVGKGGIVNIEREAEMSGRIHSKGVYILNGYLGGKYAQNKPLALSASIGFEQLYEEIEGDSASSAELYCLVSSLADVPLRQGIAVTGSVDQNGNIQAVGGINEKIEGYFDVCKRRGLEGNHGVLMPADNVKHLMLKEEVVEAVQEGAFHVHAVHTVAEGIQILTGMPFGEPLPDGTYPSDTFNHKVDIRLATYAEVAEEFEGKKETDE